MKLTMFKLKHILFFIAIFFIGITLWFQRSIFFERYDAKYMHDYYSFSQWSLPLSSRIMGDDALYSYSGYSLMNSFKPFDINPETPIFAKLFFGFSAKYFGNQHYASALFIALLLLGLDTLVKKHLKFSKTKRIVLALLVFTSAEIQQQMVSSVLDLPQIMLFVWHLVFLFNIKNKIKNNFYNALISGLLLGFLSATKTPLYTPFIFLADFYYLYKIHKQKLPKYALIIFLSTIVGYTSIYTPIIISDGIQSFISAQKWIVNFFLDSRVEAVIGMIIPTTLTGLYRGWSGSEWRILDNWDISWSIGVITLMYYFYDWLIKKKNLSFELKTIILISGAIFLLLIKLPFWPRYLVFLIPFFYILILNSIKNKKLLLLLLIIPTISTSKLIFNSYKLPQQYQAFLESSNYEELYNYFSKEYKSKITRDEFTQQSLNEYENIQTQDIEFKILEETKTSEQINQKVLIIYNGIFGNKESYKDIVWIREHNKWKILNINTTLEKTDITLQPAPFFCINPVNVKNWSTVFDSIKEYYVITQDKIINVNTMLSRLVPRDYCLPIDTYNTEYKGGNYTFPEGIEVVSPFTLP